MKIPVPFLLSGDGWGLLIDAGCAMKYRGGKNTFTFELDAAETVSFRVIRGKDCAEVLIQEPTTGFEIAEFRITKA